jgi:hypothetical protein
MTVSDVLNEVSINLQNIELDENNMACVRFNIGEQTWKVNLIWNVEDEELKISIRRRD